MAHLNYEGLKRYDKKTKEYIEDKIKNINNIDVDKLATKAELDTKANKSDLFSGNYDDLTNKPTIPDVSNLASKTELRNHTDDSSIHVTSSEKNKWNNKLDNTDLTNYATKTYVTDAIANYCKKADFDALKTEVEKLTISDKDYEEIKSYVFGGGN